jgi:hypothetical protein
MCSHPSSARVRTQHLRPMPISRQHRETHVGPKSPALPADACRGCRPQAPAREPRRRPSSSSRSLADAIRQPSAPLQHVQHHIYFWNIQIKYLQHMSETDETLERCVYNHSNICNIQVKHLKHRFATCVYYHIPNLLLQHLDETLETRRRQRLRPIWWGTAVASKIGSGDVEIKLMGLLSRMHNLYKPRGVYAHDIYFFSFESYAHDIWFN